MIAAGGRAPARALFSGLIDYAGLFPPAQLPMPAAVHNYAHYLHIPFSWMLGRFVVPAARLEEFELEAMPHFSPATESGWRLTLLSTDPAQDAGRLRDFNSRNAGAVIDNVEVKTGSSAAIESAAGCFPDGVQVYCEIPVFAAGPLLAAVASVRVRAKLRCGGVTADVFPSSLEVASFLRQCHAAGVSFKLTAGLHHAIRGTYPLTYEANSPAAVMHGFLNVFLAAAWVKTGLDILETVELLEERTASNFVFLPDAVRWRSRRLSTEAIQEARGNFALSFGSCSFSEPVAELRNLSLIP